MSNLIAPSPISIKPLQRPRLTDLSQQAGVRFASSLYGQNSAGDKPPTGPRKPNYTTPHPNAWAMSALTFLNDYLVFNGIPVLRQMPLINQLPGVQGLIGIDRVDLPIQDLQRLKAAINPKTVAFVGPNHPEFFTDWVMDKKLSSVAAPSMACWADASIVNGSFLSRKFMLANHIIANNGKEKAREDSIKAAINGHGVLLHPEGRVWWHGDKVHPIFPGIAEMAVDAARHKDSGEKPVYVVPIAWKFEFNGDVSPGLHKDMADIANKLGLSVSADLPVGKRFFKLQEAILAHQEKQFGMTDAQQESQGKLPYFKRQDYFQDFLLQKMERKYGQLAGHSTAQRYQSLERAIFKAGKEEPKKVTPEDKQVMKELFRLQGFTPELYNRPFLTQEHLHENLKRNMQSFFGGLKTMFPQPAGSRVAHIRVANPIQVRDYLTDNADGKQVSAKVQLAVQHALQSKLDEINGEIAPSVRRFQVENEFYVPQPFVEKSRL